ncbi:MAG: CPBP family intramembrane metalloprotease [Acetatifactor sp.]
MKKTVLKRLVIFLVLTFSITWGTLLLCDLLFPDPEEAAVRGGLFSAVGMMGPALGHLLTRRITGEGWKGTYLQLLGEDRRQKRRGKWLHYHLAVWGQLTLILASVALLCLYKGVPISLQYSGAYSVGLLLFNIAVGFVGLLIYFGEEWGWRGYLFPRLKELTGTVPALLLTGTVWGLWHLPELLRGMNFGTDLPGYPVSNVLLMCVYCILTGTFLTWLTDRSGSIWPATLAHMLQDHAAGVLTVLFVPEEILRSSDGMGKFYCNLAVMLPLALFTVWAMTRQKSAHVKKRIRESYIW